LGLDFYNTTLVSILRLAKHALVDQLNYLLEEGTLIQKLFDSFNFAHSLVWSDEIKVLALQPKMHTFQWHFKSAAFVVEGQANVIINSGVVLWHA